MRRRSDVTNMEAARWSVQMGGGEVSNREPAHKSNMVLELGFDAKDVVAGGRIFSSKSQRNRLERLNAVRGRQSRRLFGYIECDVVQRRGIV